MFGVEATILRARVLMIDDLMCLNAISTPHKPRILAYMLVVGGANKAKI